MVLPHGLQVAGGLVVLGVDRDKDGRDGAEQADPSGAPEHGARGDDGVQEAVVVGPVAARVDGRLDDLRLLLDDHYVAGGSGLCRRWLSVRWRGRFLGRVPLLWWVPLLRRIPLLRRVPLLGRVGSLLRRVASLLGRVGWWIVGHGSLRLPLLVARAPVGERICGSSPTNCCVCFASAHARVMLAESRPLMRMCANVCDHTQDDVVRVRCEFFHYQTCYPNTT